MYRNHKALFFVVPVLASLLVLTSLYLSRDYVFDVVLPKLHSPVTTVNNESEADVKQSGATSPSQVLEGLQTPTPSPVLETTSIVDGAVLQASKIEEYIRDILNPDSKTTGRLQCPKLNATRYALLQHQPETSGMGVDQIEHFFALNLRNNLELLPRLIGSVVQAIQFLGPQHCALSIVEGNSPDGTADVLEALEPSLNDLGIEYFFSSSEINPKKGDRIEKLAKLRNLALEPLVASLEGRVSSNTTVVFVNDVAACPDDLLELALQRQNIGADMTCAMDWTYLGPHPTFYDVWVSRGINGDSFFEIPKGGSWDYAWNLFWNDANTKTRLEANQPFQVYSCWNGAVAFTAAPLQEGLRFRSSKKDHCHHGEPQNFCKDLWIRGYGKIAVIPTVNLEYSNEQAAKIKKLKGYVSDLVKQENEYNNLIEWAGPPKKVKCIQGWDHQFWKPWKASRRDIA